MGDRVDSTNGSIGHIAQTTSIVGPAIDKFRFVRQRLPAGYASGVGHLTANARNCLHSKQNGEQPTLSSRP